MACAFTEQWSNALGLDVAMMGVTQHNIDRLSEAMHKFIKLCATNGDVNVFHDDTPLLQHVGDNAWQNLEYGIGMQVNDQTRLMKDALPVQAAQAIQGQWPAAWERELKEPLLLFTGYAHGLNHMVNHKAIDVDASLPIFISMYIKNHGIEALRERVDTLDQFLPHVLRGTAMALFQEDVAGMERFAAKVQALGNDSNGQPIKPAPSVFLDMLLASRTTAPQFAPA